MTDTTLSSLRPNEEPGFPPPKRRTWLRMTVPLAIIAAAGALLAATGWDAIRPRRAAGDDDVGVRPHERKRADARGQRLVRVLGQAPGTATGREPGARDAHARNVGVQRPEVAELRRYLHVYGLRRLHEARDAGRGLGVADPALQGSDRHGRAPAVDV